MTSSHSPHFPLDGAGLHPLWLLNIRETDSTLACVHVFFTRSELKIHGGWGLRAEPSPHAQGKQNTETAPYFSIYMRYHPVLTRLPLGPYPVLSSPTSCPALYYNTLAVSPFPFDSLELLLSTCFLVPGLSAHQKVKFGQDRQSGLSRSSKSDQHLTSAQSTGQTCLPAVSSHYSIHLA